MPISLQPPTKREINQWRRFKDGSTFAPGSAPVTQSLIMGVSEWSHQQDGNAIVNALKSYNANAELMCVRRYQGDIPANFSSTRGPIEAAAGKASWLSFSGPSIAAINSGSMDATLASYFASIPNGHTHFFTYLHEANNKDDEKLGGATRAQFTSACARIWNIKNANAWSTTKVMVGPILTAEPFRNGTYIDYFPTGGQFDFGGADPYRFARDINDPSYLPDPKAKGPGTKRTMQYLVGELPAYLDSVGKPMAIGEYGAHTWSTDDGERARWLWETDAFFVANNTIVACYFHSPNGESGPWLIDRKHIYSTGQYDAVRQTGAADPTSMQAFANIVASHKPA